MGFNTGDRVHITRFGHKEVNFYATLTNFYFNSNAKTAQLANCSNTSFEDENVYLPSDESFGVDKVDYYTLVTDEVEAPIDYNSESYKEAETFFSGFGRF